MTGEEIKVLRKKMGLTQEDFASKVGARTTTISRWETGKQRPGRMARKLLDLMKERVDREAGE